MADVSISEQDIFRTTLSAVTEVGHCTLPVEDVTQDEITAMNSNCTDMDIDYFMMKETCSVLLSKEPVVNLLADFSAEFFPRPIRENIYSAIVKETLVFGKIGDYKIGIVTKEKGQTEPIFDAEEDNNDYEDDITNNVSYNFINERLQIINYNWQRGHSFLNMKELLLEHFSEFILVIYKYGQKAPYRQLAPRIVSIFSDAGIPVEIAFGKQFKMENYFLSAKFIDEYRNYAFSNFLSNSMCNIRINNPTYAQTIAPNCYRMTLYNSLQHYKKDINFALTKQANALSCKLNQFQQSFSELDDKLKIISNRLETTELRMELYFTITTMRQYNDSLFSMRSLLTSFQIVKKNVEQLKTYFRQRRKLLKAFFSQSNDFEDEKTLYFLFFYEKYIKFIDSSQAMTLKFLKTNCGLYLPERWLDKESKLLTKFFYDDWSIVQVWTALKNIFSGRNDALTVATYYFLQYIQHFYRFIEAEPDQMEYCVEQVGNLLVNKEKVTNNQLSWETSSLPMQPLLRLMLQKLSKNPFWKGILSRLVDISSANTVFLRKLETMLVKAEFKIPLNNVVHSIAKDGYATSDPTSFPKILAFSQRTNYDEFIQEIAKRPRPSNAQLLKDISYCESLFSAFKKEIPNCERHFHGTTAIPIQCKFHCEFDVFLSFLLNNVAVDLSGSSNEMRKAVSYFYNFQSFSLYVYAGLWKYYKSEVKIPDVLKSYILNTLCCREYKKGTNMAMKNKRLTLTKMFYFTGRFDRRGAMEGLYLPANCRIDLIPRVGKQSHKQLLSSSNVMLSLAGITTPQQVFPNQHEYIFPDSGYDSDLLMSEVRPSESPRRPAEEFDEFGDEFWFDEELLSNGGFIDKITNNATESSRNGIEPQMTMTTNSNSNSFQNSITRPVFNSPFTPTQSLSPSAKRLALEKSSSLATNVLSLPSSHQSQTPTRNMGLPVNETFRNPIVNQSHGAATNIPDRVLTFEEKLHSIFPDPGQKPFIAIMIRHKITENLLITTTKEELEEYLQAMCNMSRIIAGAISTELKENFK